MRFNRLDLITYGKFSSHAVEFPAAQQDFHLIVGPNEAGKSTLRAAIVDLLFGIPARSAHNFLHPLNELRLGAIISSCQGQDTLEFHRAKAQRQTLRSPLDVILPDTILTSFLGTADRSFFDQMFGLDHGRLVSGGNSILNAENDVGQILFQSAAGIASLGKVRDALVAEADKLWAPRKSNDRDYYIAAEQYEKASAALKEATVRTKVWVDINSKVEALQESLEREREHHRQLQNQRSSFERIRRLAPFLFVIRETERKLAELGEVIDLPLDAAAMLSAAEQALAIARQRLTLRNDEVATITAALANIQVDEALLSKASDLKKLDDLRLQYSAYEKDIGHRIIEKEAIWQEVCHLCTQLDWAYASEHAIVQRLPTLLVQRALRQLIRDHSGIVQALYSAELAERNKQAEVETLAQQLNGLPSTELRPELRAALAKAKAIGDAEANVRKQQLAVNNAQTSLEHLRSELGQWCKPLADLSLILPPSPAKISRLFQERQTLMADQRAELSGLHHQKLKVAKIELAVSQFKALHHPTTYAAVLLARQERDASWIAIKTDTCSLQQAAEQFEATMLAADHVADRRTDDVEEATELQSLQHQLEQEQQTLSVIEAHCVALAQKIQYFDESWAQQASELTLIGMPLEEIGAWVTKRENVLAAAAVAQAAQDGLDAICKEVSVAKFNLIDALQATGRQAADPDDLAVLVVQAEAVIQAVDEAKVRRETLSNQLLTAKSLATSLRQAAADALADKARWSEAWLAVLTKAGLSSESDIKTVEGTLELIGNIAEKLNKMRQIQVERIDTMNADLKAFSIEANRLASLLAPDLADKPANQIAIALTTRLTQAQELYKDRERFRDALQKARSQVQEANEAIQTATASLQPLLKKANVATHALLSEAIGRSDEFRRLNIELLEARHNLLKNGDGLTRLQIEAEIDAADLIELPSMLARINDEFNDTVQRQNACSADLANEARLLADIGGSDVAARAEAQRQEALAKMADVAERYVKVFTAERLLRWSIDRYRAEKQGPLLERAGLIFSTLTSGSFRKLVVDFDREPMVLEGLRSDGKLVGVSGLSDGTRDQLYLALRLAALELHLEQAMPLPFIADDLFINYDDVRSKAGFEALRTLSERTQVIFLSHHDHLIPTVQAVFGKEVNIVFL